MSSQGPAIVHFEVYAWDGARWTLRARFRRDEKEDAQVEAKQIEQSGTAAKIVRETYYPGDNNSEDSLIYISDKSLRQPRAAPPAYRARGYARSSGSEPETLANAAIPEFRRPRGGGQRPGSMNLVLKLLLIVGASLTIALGVTGIVHALFAKIEVAVQPEWASLVTFGTFVVAFLATAVPLSFRMIDWQERPSAPLAGPARHKAFAAPEPTASPAPPAPPKEQPVAEEPPPELQMAEAPIPSTDDPPEAIEPIEPLPLAEPTADEPEAPEEAVPAPEELSFDPVERLNAGRMTMMRFLSGMVAELKKSRPTLDAYNKFGANLLLAGAVDVLGQQRRLDPQDIRSILKDSIEVIGTRGEAAIAFADRYESYLVEPRYMSMLQGGRNAMEGFLTGGEGWDDLLAPLFESWNRPHQASQPASRIVTILFTDMVGSTDLTQSRGDVAAQDLVRRHNSIVRGALADCSGKEIKHTGDGIMASFASSANAVEAAVIIQKAVAAHNRKREDLQLHLRIGINAGEPIEEEDDLFGSTVQLAARVCAQSGTDQIYCTNVVRELASGKTQVFASRGPHQLKGFKDPVQLFEVLWNTAPRGSDPADEAKVS